MLPRRPLEQKAATAAKLDRRLAPLQKEAETAQRRADDLWKALADKKEKLSRTSFRSALDNGRTFKQTTAKMHAPSSPPSFAQIEPPRQTSINRLVPPPPPPARRPGGLGTRRLNGESVVLAIMLQARRLQLLQSFLETCSVLRCHAYPERDVLPSDGDLGTVRLSIESASEYLANVHATPPRRCCPRNSSASATFYFCTEHVAATLKSQSRFLPALAHVAAKYRDDFASGRAQWLIMVDDDSHIRPDRLITALRRSNASQPLYYGDVVEHPTTRRLKNWVRHASAHAICTTHNSRTSCIVPASRQWSVTQGVRSSRKPADRTVAYADCSRHTAEDDTICSNLFSTVHCAWCSHLTPHTQRYPHPHTAHAETGIPTRPLTCIHPPPPSLSPTPLAASFCVRWGGEHFLPRGGSTGGLRPMCQ